MLYSEMKRLDREFDAIVDSGRGVTDRERSAHRSASRAYRDAVPATLLQASLKLREAWKTLSIHESNRRLVAALKRTEGLVRDGRYTVATIRELRQIADECRCLDESLGWPEGLIDSALQLLGRPRLAVQNS